MDEANLMKSYDFLKYTTQTFRFLTDDFLFISQRKHIKSFEKYQHYTNRNLTTNEYMIALM